MPEIKEDSSHGLEVGDLIQITNTSTGEIKMGRITANKKGLIDVAWFYPVVAFVLRQWFAACRWLRG